MSGALLVAPHKNYSVDCVEQREQEKKHSMHGQDSLEATQMEKTKHQRRHNYKHLLLPDDRIEY
jgi:hypothetical protein